MCSGADGPRRKPSTTQPRPAARAPAARARRPHRFDRCRPSRSMSLVGDHLHRNPLGAAEHRAKELGPALGIDLLRVVQQRERANAMVAQRSVVEQHARDDQRPGQRAASCLVSPGDEPCAEAAVEAKESLPRLRLACSGSSGAAQPRELLRQAGSSRAARRPALFGRFFGARALRPGRSSSSSSSCLGTRRA